MVGAMFAAGMVFGPAGGGILFAKFGFAMPFYVAAGLQFLTLVITVVMLPESRSRTHDDYERFSLRAVLSSFGEPKLARILWQKLALSLALYGWFAVFALYFQRQLGFSLAQTDYFFSLFAVFNVLNNAVVVGRVSARLGDRGMSNLGLASLVCGFAVLPFVHELALMTVTMLLFSFGMALANTGIVALISNAASDREQGRVLGDELRARLTLRNARAAGLDESARRIRPAFCRRGIVDAGSDRARNGTSRKRGAAKRGAGRRLGGGLFAAFARRGFAVRTGAPLLAFFQTLREHVHEVDDLRTRRRLLGLR